MAAITLCLINQKGGCGKSSTCFHLAGAYAALGYSVLLVDADPQGSLSQGFLGSDFVEQLPASETLAALFDENCFFLDQQLLIRPTGFDKISIVPANQHLADFNAPKPATAGMTQFVIREFLEQQDAYDIVMIDCPPNLYQCSWNSMIAANYVVKVFNKYVEDTQNEQGEVTTAGLIKLAREHASKRKKPNAATEPTTVENCNVVNSLGQLVEGRKFACVYVDAPWPVGNEPSVPDAVGLENFRIALLQQPIPELVEEHSHLHMWATDESLFTAKQVMEGWGFEFKGTLVCLSTLGRPGNYWVEAHEYLLLGVRGNLPLMERGMNSWMRAMREPDGRTPDRIRRLVERVSPGPYLELFGQKPVSGWTIYSTMPQAIEQEVQSENVVVEGCEDAETTSS